MKFFYIVRSVSYMTENICFERPYDERREDDVSGVRERKVSKIIKGTASMSVAEDAATKVFEKVKAPVSKAKHRSLLGSLAHVYQCDENATEVSIYELPVVGDMSTGSIFTLTFIASSPTRGSDGFLDRIFLAEKAYTDYRLAENAVRHAFIFNGGETPEPIDTGWTHSAQAKNVWAYMGTISDVEDRELDLEADITEWVL